MLKLIVSPNPILLEKAVDWDFSADANANDLEKEMISIMETFNGIGLAANQVGILKRVFVIKLKDKDAAFGMFNPKLVSVSKEQQSNQEGCLSFPNLWLDVKRPASIDVEYLDSAGNECKITLKGIDARCFLHELDHLDGKVFTEKVNPMALMLAQKKQKSKRKYNG